MPKLILFFAFTGLFLVRIQAQSSKTTVAVFPLQNLSRQHKIRAVEIQQSIMEILGRKANLKVLDRSNDSLFVKELDLQIREHSMDAPGLVKQGKLLGAQQMITGVFSDINVTRSKEQNSLTRQNYTVYSAVIIFSLQLSDVESGEILSQKTFNSRDAKTKLLNLVNLGAAVTGETEEAAISNGMNAVKKMIAVWIGEVYAPEIKILKIDDIDKKGVAETVLVTGIDESFGKGTELNVNEIEMLDSGAGKSLRRTKKIAELKIKEIQGDVTICRITDGAKVLQEKISNKVNIEIIVKK